MARPPWTEKRRAHAAVDRVEFGIDQPVGDGVLLATGLVHQADDAELAELHDQIARNRFSLPPCLHVGRDVLPGEGTGLVAQLALEIGVLGLEVERIGGGEARGGGCHGKLPSWDGCGYCRKV